MVDSAAQYVKHHKIMGFRIILVLSHLGIILAFCVIFVFGFNEVVDTLTNSPSNLPKPAILNLSSKFSQYLLVAVTISVLWTIGISWAIAKRVSKFSENLNRFLQDIVQNQAPLEQCDSPDLTGGFTEFSKLPYHLNELITYFQDNLHTTLQSAQTTQMILDSISESTLLIDQKFIIEYGNQSAFDLLEVDNSKKGMSLIEINRTPKLHEVVKYCVETQKAHSDEIQLDSVNKTIVSLMVIPLSEGAHFWTELEHRYLVIMKDVSMLRKLQQVRSDFITNASHELRTPLTAIQGYAETLLDTGNTKKKQRQQFIIRIYEQAIYLSGLISDLLNLSKIESGGMKLNFQNYKVVDLRKKITNLFEPLFSESKMNFEWEIPDDPTEIYVDPELITQVLVNLIDNAIKYTESGGTISVSFQTKEDNIIFQIKDMGIGIPKQELERIFERFYRVDTDSTNKVKGTGLGLSIAKHIVLQHDGRIWVESEVGKGTNVFFSVKKGTAK